MVSINVSREMPEWFTILLAKVLIPFETSCFITNFQQGHMHMGSPRKLPSFRMEVPGVGDRVYAHTIYCTYTNIS